MNSWIVETRGLKKYYKLGDNTVKALDGVDFRVKEQEFVAIIGKSGSGKSTLLHMVGGLDTPTEGTVSVSGKLLAGMTKEELSAHLDPSAYIGRCPEQVEEFLAGAAAPVLEKYAGALEGKETELNV